MLEERQSIDIAAAVVKRRIILSIMSLAEAEVSLINVVCHKARNEKPATSRARAFIRERQISMCGAIVSSNDAALHDLYYGRGDVGLAPHFLILH